MVPSFVAFQALVGQISVGVPFGICVLIGYVVFNAFPGVGWDVSLWRGWVSCSPCVRS